MRRRVVCLAIAIAACAVPSTAEAELYCVAWAHGGCDGLDRDTVPEAIADAAGAPGEDVIRLWEGTYFHDQEIVVPAAADGAIHIVGFQFRGADATVLTREPGTPPPRLEKAGSTIERLQIRVPDDPGSAGVELAGDVSAADLVVSGAGDGLVGARLAGGAALSAARFDLPGAGSVGVLAEGDGTVADVEIAACVGARSEGGLLRVARVATEGGTGFEAVAAGSLDVDSSSAWLTGRAGCAEGAGLALRSGGAGPRMLTGRNVTVAGGSHGVLVRRDEAGSSVVDLHSTVLHDVGAAVEHQVTAGTAATTLRSSAFDPATVVGTAVAGDGNFAAPDPGFADAASGDLRLVPGSPLHDRGLPGDDAAWSPFDLGQLPRVVGPRRDVGAHELPAEDPAPAGPPVAPPAPAPPAGSSPPASSRPPVVVPVRVPRPVEQPPPTIRLVASRVDRSGRVALRVGCPAGGTRCSGRVVVHRSELVLGRGSFSTGAGRSAVVRVRIGVRGLRTLRRKGRLRMRATVLPDGARVVSTSFTVRPAPRG